jgi:glycosyltransferase involved in cell wall biosynthesis
MKVLHVIHSIDPRSGGPSNSLRELLAAQRRGGLILSLLTTTAQACEPWADRVEFSTRMKQEDAFHGVELYLGRAYGRRRPWSRVGFTPECVRWLKRRCQDAAARPDVIHIHGVYSHLTQAAARIAASFRIPYVIRPAGSLDPAAIAIRNSWAKRLMMRGYLRGQLRSAGLVHATSDVEADSIRSGFPEAHVVVVPHGVSIPGPVDPESLRNWYTKFPKLSGKRLLLFISRLHAKKQPELLVRALGTLLSEFPDLVLVLAGPDSGHREFLEEEVRRVGVEEAVVFTDFLQGAMKQAAFETAAVFALPSRHENYGVAVVEAMAHGVPVLVSMHVATHEYVDAAGAGVTVIDTVDGVTAGLSSLLRQDRETLGKRGCRFVSENLSWESVERQLRQHYESMLAAPHAGACKLSTKAAVGAQESSW